ncbi:unnamed protein product [Larinioides sclopetarius]|uniref:Uncharacterized protein n=1 Tax=Larinioides sclopetarius TaxID=280406 RepID=A0AAV2ADA7_9ARAC
MNRMSPLQARPIDVRLRSLTGAFFGSWECVHESF